MNKFTNNTPSMPSLRVDPDPRSCQDEKRTEPKTHAMTRQRNEEGHTVVPSVPDSCPVSFRKGGSEAHVFLFYQLEGSVPVRNRSMFI